MPDANRSDALGWHPPEIEGNVPTRPVYFFQQTGLHSLQVAWQKKTCQITDDKGVMRVIVDNGHIDWQLSCPKTGASK